MIESIKCKGSYIVEAYSLDGKLISRKVYENVVVQNFFTTLFNFLNVNNQDQAALYLNYFAVGTDTTQAAKTDTLLGAETFRKSITQKTFNNTRFTCQCELAPSEAVGVIREFGVFANATATADSGTMISHVNVNISKNSSTKYIITYILEVL